MAYPPSPIEADVTNVTPTPDLHPLLHNELAAAVATIVAELGAGPKGSAADVTARLTAVDVVLAALGSASTHPATDFDTPAARDTAITTAVTNLINGAPGALDTLNELATALGDDANFSATVTAALGNRLLWRGAWAATTAYVTNDMVTFNGGLYRAPSNFTSGGSFVLANWVQLVPQSGTYALLAATAAQTFNGKVAVNQASATDEALHLTTTNAASGPYAGIIDAYGNGLKITQTHDWSGATVDLIDITFRSTGDAIYVVHLGGHPTTGDAGGGGGNSCFNVLIPYYRDFAASGYDGTVVNTNTGMQGLFIGAQPTGQGVKPLAIVSSSEQGAISITNQPTGHPVGNGRAIDINDWTTASSVHINRNTAPAVGAADSASSAVIRIVDTVNTDGLSASGHNVLALGDNTGNRLLVDSNGALKWIAHGSGNAVNTSLSFGGTGVMQLAASLQLADVPGQVGQNHPTVGVEKLLGSAVGLLTGSGTEYMRWGAGVSFFGATAQGQTAITGVKGNVAWNNAFQQFRRLGFVTDSTTSRVVTKSGTYTAKDGEYVLANATTSAFTVTLPAVAADGEVIVKKTDSSANAVTVTPASGTIDGAASKVLSTQWSTVRVICDGTNWFIVSTI